MDGTVSPQDRTDGLKAQGYLKEPEATGRASSRWLTEEWSLSRVRGTACASSSSPRSPVRSPRSPRQVHFADWVEGTEEPVQRVSSAPSQSGELGEDAKEHADHKHKKTVNFGYRYSIVIGCGEFSQGRRVSDVERMKQFERRLTWLQESQRLGYGGDQSEESTEGLQMPFRDETADAPVTTRRRSRSDYNANVFQESGQDSGIAEGKLQKLEDFLDLGPECPEQSTASTSCDTGGEADLTGKSGKFKERGRAKTSSLETEFKDPCLPGRRRAYTADVL